MLVLSTVGFSKFSALEQPAGPVKNLPVSIRNLNLEAVVSMQPSMIGDAIIFKIAAHLPHTGLSICVHPWLTAEQNSLALYLLQYTYSHLYGKVVKIN